jgi:type IV secretion system protein VirD4
MRPQEQRDPHWDDKAASLIKTALLAIATGAARTSEGDPYPMNMRSVRRLLSQPTEGLFDFLNNLRDRTEILNGLLSRSAGDTLVMADQEFGSVMSSVAKHLEFLDSEHAMSSLTQEKDDNNFDFSRMDAWENVSIYLVLPPHYIPQYARLLRLWITLFTLVMARGHRRLDAPPVLFMLDEAAQLGRLDVLMQATSLMGGYGATFWMIWQDLAQIKSLYPQEWTSILANARIQQFFGVNDTDTASYVCEMLGTATITVSNRSAGRAETTSGAFSFRQDQISAGNASFAKERMLLTKDEVRRTSREFAIVLAQGCAPILSRRFVYFEDEEFKGRAHSGISS